MSIKQTMLLSILFHSMIASAAFLPLKGIPPENKTFIVELEREVIGSPERDNGIESQVHGGINTKPRTLVVPEKKRQSRPTVMISNVQQMVTQPISEKVEHPTVSEPETTGISAEGEMVSAWFAQGTLGKEEGLLVSVTGSTGLPSKGQGHDSPGYSFHGLIGHIRMLIERATVYPALARKRGQEGTVVAEFLVNTKGLPENITIVKSSGFQILDAAARDTILRAAPFPHVRAAIEVPITFSLKKEYR